MGVHQEENEGDYSLGGLGECRLGNGEKRSYHNAGMGFP